MLCLPLVRGAWLKGPQPLAQIREVKLSGASDDVMMVDYRLAFGTISTRFADCLNCVAVRIKASNQPRCNTPEHEGNMKCRKGRQ